MFILLAVCVGTVIVVGVGALIYSVKTQNQPLKAIEANKQFADRAIDLASTVLTYDDAGMYMPEQLIIKAKTILGEK